MRIRYLLDENLRGLLAKSVERHNISSGFPLDTVLVGERNDLPLGSTDPEILAWASSENRLLVTDDRKSMISHFTAFLSHQHRSPGVLLLRPRATVHDVLDCLVLIAYASEPVEWENGCHYIPT